MKKIIKESGLVIALIFIFSYLFNFVWESFHAVFLYQNHDILAQKYVLMMNYVSLVDAFYITIIYLAVSLLWRNLFWVNQTERKHMFTFIIIGLIIAFLIEYRAVFILNKWSYNSLMPTIFGIGLSPLVQLSITGVLVITLVKWIVYKKY